MFEFLKKLFGSKPKPEKPKLEDLIHKFALLQMFDPSKEEKEEWYYDRNLGITYYVSCPPQKNFFVLELLNENGKFRFKDTIELKVGRTFHNPKDRFVKEIAREQSKKNAKLLPFKLNKAWLDHFGWRISNNIDFDIGYATTLDRDEKVQAGESTNLSDCHNELCIDLFLSFRGSRIHPWLEGVSDWSYTNEIDKKRKYSRK
jgi:hypothetical protein